MLLLLSVALVYSWCLGGACVHSCNVDGFPLVLCEWRDRWSGPTCSPMCAHTVSGWRSYMPCCYESAVPQQPLFVIRLPTGPAPDTPLGLHSSSPAGELMPGYNRHCADDTPCRLQCIADEVPSHPRTHPCISHPLTFPSPPTPSYACGKLCLLMLPPPPPCQTPHPHTHTS